MLLVDLNKHAQTVITRVTQALLPKTEVIALVLVGSQTKIDGSISPHSDIEIYSVVSDSEAESVITELPRIVNTLGSVLFSYKNRWAGFSTVFDSLLRLELPVITRSQMRSVFSRPKAQTVTVLFDKTAGELESILAARPQTIDFAKEFEDSWQDFWYMTIVASQCFAKGELWNCRHVLEVSLTPAIIRLMCLAQIPQLLLLERNKRLEGNLAPEQLKLLERLSPTYEKESIRHALHTSITLFSRLAKEVRQKYRFTYTIEIEEKIIPKLQQLLG